MSNLSDKVMSVIDETQTLIINGLSIDRSNIDLPRWIDSIKAIADTPDELLKSVLGTTGQQLKRFAIRINVEHPDLESYFGSLGNSAINLFAEAANVVYWANIAGKLIENVEVVFLAKDASWLRIIRVLQQPRTRLLSNLEDRQNYRQIKKQVKSVGLKSILKGENSFFGQPSHFKRFACGSSYYREELAKLQERQELFVNKNMHEMVHVYAKRMRELEESISDVLGFYRIRPDEASVILARLHGFGWNDSGIITIPSKYFRESRFWFDSAIQPTEEEKIDGLKKAIVLNTQFAPTSNNVNFTYQPRMYSLCQWSSCIALPNRVLKILDQAEKFAKLNNSPFFDYYWVLVPSIQMNHPLIQRHKDHWTIQEGKATVIYEDLNQATVALDTKLVKDGLVVPIIIGERDGNCFFLSHMI